MKLLETFKETLDKVNSVNAIFMDLSKAFDTLNHGLLIAKLAYGFSAKSLSYIHSYRNKQLQKTNVNCDFSIWKGIPQKIYYLLNILYTLLLNVYMKDIFFFADVAFGSNDTDDIALYSIQ